MTSNSRIQWTEETWNPVTGCSKVSAGCKNCYAERTALRLQKMNQANYVDGFAVRCHPHMLAKPINWKRPRKIFVNSMSDLFHEEVPDEFIEDVFNVMLEADHHIYQVLTKRPERMRDFLYRYYDCDCWECRGGGRGCGDPAHIWIGTSVENKKTLSRIDRLAEAPAAVRFVSFEPLLEHLDALELTLEGGKIHWAIMGGESGPGSRACEVEWIEHIILACREAGVAPFVKQMGSVWAKQNKAKHSKGGNPDEWPERLRVREFPEVSI